MMKNNFVQERLFKTKLTPKIGIHLKCNYNIVIQYWKLQGKNVQSHSVHSTSVRPISIDWNELLSQLNHTINMAAYYNYFSRTNTYGIKLQLATAVFMQPELLLICKPTVETKVKITTQKLNYRLSPVGIFTSKSHVAFRKCTSVILDSLIVRVF